MSKKTNKKKRQKSNNGRPEQSWPHDRIEFWGDTNQGLVRKKNEDAFACQKIWDDNNVLAIVIDGLGGYEGGEEAARIAKEVIVNYLEASSNGDRLELLKQAVASANNTIYERSRFDVRYRLMGCVLTAIIVDITNNSVYMAHVGDSRLYCFHDSRLLKLSHDHSYVGHMEEIGDLTEEQAMHHPNRNVVDRIIGQEHHLASDKGFIEAKVFSLEPQSTFLLCSDGLTDMITSVTISGVLSRESAVKEKVDMLIKEALEAGGRDNVTVVLVDYKDNTSKEEFEDQIDDENKGASERMTKQRDKKHNKTWVIVLFSLVLGLMLGFIIGQRRNIHDNKEKTQMGTTQTDTLRRPSPILLIDSLEKIGTGDSTIMDSN